MFMKLVKLIIKIALRISLFAGCVAAMAFLAERFDELKSKGNKHMHKPFGIYERFIKRPLDCFLATGALIVFSPVMLVLTVLGVVKMGGNPFFTQDRPGRNGKIFRLIKFRSMNNKKDENGNLLSDDVRLTSYGKALRATSLDELPELINIVKGDMAVVGPRPLLVEYLSLYDEKQKHRHDVRPGFTGMAQVNGRNSISWEEKFDWDLKYVNRITALVDLKIIGQTAVIVLKRDGVNSTTAATMEAFKGSGVSV